MLTFSLPVLLLILSATTAQSYNATGRFFLACGSPSSTASSPSPTTSTSERIWESDENSRYLRSNIKTTSFTSPPSQPDTSASRDLPYSYARIFNTSSFTYTFPVTHGPKFLRLYFYPGTYLDLKPEQSFFSVSSNGFSLVHNFSAFQASSFLTKIRLDAGGNDHQVHSFVKEFIIYVKDTESLNVTFTPAPNSYAFINGIEIVSMPEDLYYNSNNLKSVGITNGPVVNNDMALENIYRLNMGGSQISASEDTGMYRSWDPDNDYVFGAAFGLTPDYGQKPITYTTETPNYTAPEKVYQHQRSMGKLSDKYNLTWRLPVDSGFYYYLRLHLCNIIPQYTKPGQVIFEIFINNQTADDEVDLFTPTTQGSGYAVYKDYVVYVNDPDSGREKQDLWVSMHPNQASQLYLDAYLNGLEAFKMSTDKSLASPNPELKLTTPQTGQTTTGKRNNNKPPYAAIAGGIGGALVLLSILVFVVFWRQRRGKHDGVAHDKLLYGESKSAHSTLPSDRCRRFSLTEVKAATKEFNDDFVIGIGGFGKVYKGYIDNANTVVAIKRLNEKSNQGMQEFHTEIGMLSKLRHVQLVSLIGYCDDEGEMILVYDYMANGTLREHLYKSNNPSLSWKRRLQICIGAAKGLHYLHTGAKRSIIHRDVKSTNILLDEKIGWLRYLILDYRS